MPYFIGAFFRGIRNIFFRRYDNPRRSADVVQTEAMSDPQIAAALDNHRRQFGSF